MRANEFIIEAKTIKVGNIHDDTLFKPSDEFNLWMNPTLNDLLSLTKRFILRGIVWDKVFIVWDAYQSTHSDISSFISKNEILGSTDGRNETSVILSDVNNINDSFDEWEGEPEVINGIYYLEDFGDVTTKPSFRRSLGIKR